VKKIDHVPRLFTTTRGEKPTFLAPRMSLFAALARRVATQISTSTMSSWCTADDTSALSASGLAQSASKFPSSRVPSALLSGAPAFPRDDKRDLVRPRSASVRSTRPLSAAYAARASIVRASMRGFWASAPWISTENRRTRPFRPEFEDPDPNDPKTRKTHARRFRSSSQSTSFARPPVPSAAAWPSPRRIST